MSDNSFFVYRNPTNNTFYLRRSNGTSFIYNGSCPDIIICSGLIDDNLTGGGLLIELQVSQNSKCCCEAQYSINNANTWIPLSGIYIDCDPAGGSTYSLHPTCFVGTP